MRRFFLGKAWDQGKAEDLAMVYSNVVCRPVKLGGLGVLKIQTINLTLLMNWVRKIMNLKADLVKMILKDCHVMGVDKEM